MIYAYSVTERGTYHIKKNTVCQDAHKIIKCRNNLVIGAVADGLGSEEHSDIASQIAVEVSTAYCAKNIGIFTSRNSIPGIIKESFALAQNRIEQTVHSKGDTIDQYDTTLTLVIMHDVTIYYGHSGDSGIVALTTEGLYEKVTEQQRDEDNRVFPLFFKEKWVFGQFNKKVCSVFLATDGMLETFFPFYIRNEPVSIYVTLARYFMDNRVLQIDKLGENKVTSQITEFIQNIPDTQVNDDKTVLVLINSSAKSALQPDEYYKEPDWEALKRKRDEEWKRQAYPHLFKDKNTEETVESSGTTTIGTEQDNAEQSPADNIFYKIIRMIKGKST